MIDPVTAYAVGPLASLDPVPQMTVPLPMPAVGAADQARFQAALHPVRDTPPGTGVDAAWSGQSLETPVSPGDRILQGMERLRTRYREVGAALESSVHETQMNPQELLGLQMQMAQVTLGTQLIGQVASKLEQNLNTLLKAS
ncbi:type III secretion system inner rod subunit SctI [Imhoffiella purpurea]|uniref:Uncharacterized protein n=1 Tax=Imhoffiella purpurea TaxID=1249627 RepID=W9VF86_9GAMM|nr:type III secretion system inner rod subunit SctI [Imhoffiella purpurea]EXJ15666.1 hypothetical protein D779_1173 [Imhoffiella purpurea]